MAPGKFDLQQMLVLHSQADPFYRSLPVTAGKTPDPNMLNSNSHAVREDLKYSDEDLYHIEEWVKVSTSLVGFLYSEVYPSVIDAVANSMLV